MFDLIKTINFSSPHFLFLAFIPVLILFASYISNLFSLNRYCDKNLLAWVTITKDDSFIDRVIQGKITATISWILFCVALSGPRMNIDQRSLEVKNKYNTATIIVLDLSRSMLVEDIYPNRISKAKLLIGSILTASSQRLFSLVIYANTAHTVIPLTYDKNVIRQVLKSIEPNMLPVEGSNFQSGLELAFSILKTSKVKDKSVILVSDGDFNQNEIINYKSEIPVNVFGLGSQEGEAIPAKTGGWLNFEGRPVISRLNEVKLKEISNYYKGHYQKITDNIDTIKIRKVAFSRAASLSTSSSDKIIVIWKSLHHWFLIPAILIFLLNTASIKSSIPLSKRKTIISLTIGIVISLLALPPSSNASNLNSKSNSESTIELADTAYSNKNYILSERLYKQIKGFDALLGQANSLYKQKLYQKAIAIYTRAILTITTNNKRSMALYNLANSYYIIGDYSQAVNIYKDTLKYKPNFRKAKDNLEYATFLEQQVKQALALRKKYQASASRLGSGPRSANVEQGMDIGTSKVTLGESSKEVSFYNLPQNNISSNQLIERGIKYSRISAPKNDAVISTDNWDYEYTTFDMVELLVKQEKIDNFNLWKRLFEIEEGFPAPVAEPQIKPGVKPW